MKRLNQLAYSLTKINSESKKMYWLLLPPVYGLWLYGISRIVSTNKTARLLMTTLSLIFTGLMIFVVWIPIPNIEFELLYSDEVLLFAANLWTLIVIVLSYLTVSFEFRILQKEEHDKPTFMDYFVRYFILTNWWAGMWSYQKIVNEYSSEQRT